MRLQLVQLTIYCEGYQEVISFGQVSYFYGKMGAGKSTIARLIDYCLGGQLPMTPALNAEFVAAELSLVVGSSEVKIERGRASTTAIVQWRLGVDEYEVVLPVRSAGADDLWPDHGVYVLSDLFFVLNDLKPPLVRRSKLRPDSELGRLSTRDLLWFCYLDQDSMDSDFFHLDAGADPFKRLKSRDVLRFVLGFHQEKVAELEADLESLRSMRLKLLGGAEALRRALEGSSVASEAEIDERLGQYASRSGEIGRELEAARGLIAGESGYITEDLREQGRRVASALAEANDAINSLHQSIRDDKMHVNEMKMLSTKARRMVAAGAVLNRVDFHSCPRCTKPLPSRSSSACRVCGQDESIRADLAGHVEKTEIDLAARLGELEEAIRRRETQLEIWNRKRQDIEEQKKVIDVQLSQAMERYDSAYMSRVIALEQERARLAGETYQLTKLRELPRAVHEQLVEASRVADDESRLRDELKSARTAAEKDAGNLRELERLFLDCLIRARVPGFVASDHVRMRSPWFVPQVLADGADDLLITSFANLGSGGKKTLFKCCFALAFHRLAAKIGAVLPSLLIIDSPMKNISERENSAQFAGFYELVYVLARDELHDTQIVLIDKELFAPGVGDGISLSQRYMSPEQPLLRGFQGEQSPATDSRAGDPAAPSDKQADRQGGDSEHGDDDGGLGSSVG